MHRLLFSAWLVLAGCGERQGEAARDAEPEAGPVDVRLPDPDGQPDAGPSDRDAQPDARPSDRDAQPDAGPPDPDAQPDTGPPDPDAQPDMGPPDPDAQPDTGPSDAALDAGPSCPELGDPVLIAPADSAKSELRLARVGDALGIVWVDTRSGAAEVFFARVDLGGAVLTPPARVTVGADGPTEPTIAPNPAGGYVLTWNEADGIHAAGFDVGGALDGADRVLAPELERHGSMVVGGDPASLYLAADDTRQPERSWLVAVRGLVAQQSFSFTAFGDRDAEIIDLAIGAGTPAFLLGNVWASTIELHITDFEASPIDQWLVCDQGCDRPEAVLRWSEDLGEFGVLHQGVGQLHFTSASHAGGVLGAQVVAAIVRGTNVTLTWGRADGWISGYVNPLGDLGGVYLSPVGGAPVRLAGSIGFPRSPSLVVDGTRRCALYLDEVEGVRQIHYICGNFACLDD